MRCAWREAGAVRYCFLGCFLPRAWHQGAGNPLKAGTVPRAEPESSFCTSGPKSARLPTGHGGTRGKAVNGGIKQQGLKTTRVDPLTPVQICHYATHSAVEAAGSCGLAWHASTCMEQNGPRASQPHQWEVRWFPAVGKGQVWGLGSLTFGPYAVTVRRGRRWDLVLGRSGGGATLPPPLASQADSGFLVLGGGIP